MNLKIKSTGDGNGTQIFSAEGQEVRGVRSASIVLTAHESNRASIDLIGITVDVEAKADFRLLHPLTGVLTKVKRIEFDDSSVWPPNA